MPAADYSAYFNSGTTPQKAVQNWRDYGNPTNATDQQLLEAFNTIANFPGGSAVAAANLIFGDGVPSASTRYQNPIEIANAIKSNPAQFTVDNALDIGSQLYFSPDVFKNYTKEAGSLGLNNTQLSQVNSNLQQGLQQAGVSQQKMKEFEATFGQDKLLKFVGGSALSFLLPGVGSAIAESLITNNIVTSQLAANVIGNAIANTAASVAQGQPLDKALTNAVVGAAVNTGSIEVAKVVNGIISSPAITDAIVSAAGSAVKTAAAGGTEQDIINNMTGALAGSAASSAYQKGGEDYTRETGRVIGSAVAGAVTGGTTGAITGAVGELGGQSKGKVAGAIEDVISPQDTGALPASQVAAMTPDTDAGAALPTVEVTAQRPADIAGTNIISPAAVTTAPAALEPVTVISKKPADITDTDVINAIAAEKTPDAVLPTVTVTGKKEEPPVLEPVTVTATRPADITDTDIIDEPAKLEDVTVTGKKEEPLLDVAVEEPPPEEKPPEEKPYKPDLFILGGKKPKAPPSKTPTSVLSQALGTTTGLTASRGAGEIEDPSTGKKKRKVWNEETLRLKDALGV